MKDYTKFIYKMKKINKKLKKNKLILYLNLNMKMKNNKLNLKLQKNKIFHKLAILDQLMFQKLIILHLYKKILLFKMKFNKNILYLINK